MEASSTVLVRNAEAKVHNIGLARATKRADGSVMQQENETITLVPGWNPVKTSLWNEAKKNHLVEYQLKEGVFEERALGPEEIKELSEADAERLILETWSDDALKRMRAAESRGPMLALINAQLAKLEPTERTKPASGAPAKK